MAFFQQLGQRGKCEVGRVKSKKGAGNDIQWGGDIINKELSGRGTPLWECKGEYREPLGERDRIKG